MNKTDELLTRVAHARTLKRRKTISRVVTVIVVILSLAVGGGGLALSVKHQRSVRVRWDRTGQKLEVFKGRLYPLPRFEEKPAALIAVPVEIRKLAVPGAVSKELASGKVFAEMQDVDSYLGGLYLKLAETKVAGGGIEQALTAAKYAKQAEGHLSVQQVAPLWSQIFSTLGRNYLKKKLPEQALVSLRQAREYALTDEAVKLLAEAEQQTLALYEQTIESYLARDLTLQATEAVAQAKRLGLESEKLRSFEARLTEDMDY